MSRETPTDQLSGLPLLLVPDESTLPILWGMEPTRDPEGNLLADWNHAWHPSRNVITAGDGGAALRNSRVQYVLRDEQHNEYHAAFDGPRLPTKPSERFKAVVLCAAGYIPPEGIMFSPDGPEIVALTDWERVRLRESGEVRVASLSTVQKFMTDFVLAQSVDHIKPRTIDRFLRIDPSESADAAKEQARLAYLLLSLVIDRVEAPLIEPYAYARRNELLAPGVPSRPDAFVLSNILRSHKNVRGVARAFDKKLKEYRDGPQAAACLGQTALVAA